MKHVDLITPPMAGHLHPALGIATRLASEPSLRVRVISTAGAQPAIRAAGLEGVALVEDADEIIDTVVNPPYRVGGNPRLLVRQLRATVALQISFQAELRALWADGAPDLALANYTMAAVGPLADELDVPWWTLHSSPCTIDGRTGPPPYLGGWRPGAAPWTRTRNAVGRAWVRGFKRLAPRLAGARTRDVGIERMYRADGSEAIYSDESILVITPEAIEYPRGLPSAVRFVGPVLHTPPSGAAAVDLAPGRRHVLVTAGTHVPWHQDALRVAVARAAPTLRAVGIDLHLSRGRLSGGPDQPPIHGLTVHDYVDYQRDLPRFDAVVHHGGSGVLGHTLSAGLPAVVWPVDYDQSDFAVRLADAGVAERLRNPDDLARLVRRVLEEPAYATAARRIADGLAEKPAVETIAEAVLGRLR